MAVRRLVPCKQNGCKERIPSGTNYCAAHKVGNSNWDKYHAGATNTQRGYGTEWGKLRARVLRRDNGLCQVCLKESSPVKATEVDHIIPRSQGGSDDMSNLQSICTHHHRIKTSIEGRR